MGTLCDPLLACISNTRCDQRAIDPFTGALGIDTRPCYCGDDVDPSSFGACFQATDPVAPAYPHGSCRTQIEVLAGTTDPRSLGSRYFDLSTPLGAIAQTETCENNACLSECCTSCTSGSGGSGSSTVVIPGDAGPCLVCAATQCAAPLAAQQSLCVETQCDPLLACISTSGCDRRAIDPFTGVLGIDTRPCYCGDEVEPINFGLCFAATSPADPTYPHGRCRDLMEALAGTTDPAAVGSKFFDPTTPLGAIDATESCENDACLAECCPTCQ